MVDIVLVHGTTQTAAGFAALVDELASRGHCAWTVDIPGGATTAADYAELLAAQLPGQLDRPVVLAHSAAGLLLPALARKLAARHQIWFAAAVADYPARRSLLAEVTDDPGAVLQPDWVGVDPTTDPILAAYFLFHDADLSTLRAALPTIAGCDLSALYAETPDEDPARIPSTYLLPTRDRTLQHTWMRRIAAERLHVEPLPIEGGHNCYTAYPAATADAITGAVADHV